MVCCKRLFAVLLTLVMLLSAVAVPVYADETEETDDILAEDDFLADLGLTLPGMEEEKDPVPLYDGSEVQQTEEKVPTYLDYYMGYSNAARYNGFISLGNEQISKSEIEIQLSEYDGISAPVLNKQNGWVEWEFEVEQDAMYSMYLNYYPIKSVSGNDIVFELTLDGSLPYERAAAFTVPRIWMDAVLENGKTIATDENGDDMRPSQEESPEWITNPLLDEQGMYTEPYSLYLTAGVHTVRISTLGEEIAIAGLLLGSNEKSVSYSEYIKKYKNKAAVKGETVVCQAESAYKKTSSMLYPTYDRTTADVTPNNCANIRLNTIGQSNWSANGQTIYWKPEIKEAGLYRIAFHANQDDNQAMNSYRTLRINGEIPFAEAENIAFPYDTKWYVKVLGDEKEMYVYLEPDDVVSLSCVAGEMSEVLLNIQNAVLSLNEIYRKIIAVTSTSPDIYQDYYLSDRIIGLEDMLLENKKLLDDTTAIIKGILGNSGGQASTIEQVSIMLAELAEDTAEIPARLGNFKTEIENLGSLILSLQSQPLELDFIAFIPENGEMPKANASLWESIAYSVGKFFASFSSQYGASLSSGKRGQISVWVSTGRDQAQILSNLIRDSFAEISDTKVVLSLIDTGTTMLNATLAGKGPDVALMVAQNYPVNLAMRGALVDLTEYDFSDIKSKTNESAWTPFYYNGGLYAVPETEAFDVMFYRKDIFEEYGIQPPQTWEEFYMVMEVLQKNNLSLGLQEITSGNNGVSASISIFKMFLFQSGGEFYNDTLTATVLDSDVAYQSFCRWADLYDKYGLDRDFSFYNLLRSGEMPIGIAGYSTYNQLVSAAPEINGLWGFTEIPGTMDENGKIDRTQSSVVSGAIVLKAAEERGVVNDAVEFVKWWTSTDVQSKYARDLEATLGVAARYTPADQTVLESIGWSNEELKVLQSSAQWLKNVEEIPGNYVVSRSLTNALRAVLSDKNDARRSLTLYNNDINDEITRKREEFGLS